MIAHIIYVRERVIEPPPPGARNREIPYIPRPELCRGPRGKSNVGPIHTPQYNIIHCVYYTNETDHNTRITMICEQNILRYYAGDLDAALFRGFSMQNKLYCIVVIIIDPKTAIMVQYLREWVTSRDILCYDMRTRLHWRYHIVIVLLYL